MTAPTRDETRTYTEVHSPPSDVAASASCRTARKQRRNAGDPPARRVLHLAHARTPERRFAPWAAAGKKGGTFASPRGARGLPTGAPTWHSQLEPTVRLPVGSSRKGRCSSPPGAACRRRHEPSQRHWLASPLPLLSRLPWRALFPFLFFLMAIVCLLFAAAVASAISPASSRNTSEAGARYLAPAGTKKPPALAVASSQTAISERPRERIERVAGRREGGSE